jgi:mannosyltransferase
LPVTSIREAAPVRPAQSVAQLLPCNSTVLDAGWIAVLAAVVSGVAAGRPSLWFDEAATVSAATRPLSGLWRLLGHIDAVHGLYYLIMHGWFTFFPASEFWSRAPSFLAVGVAAAGVVVLGRQLSSRSVAVCAGLVFAILPRVTWAGVEARSYAFSAMAAVWLTILLVSAVRRNRRPLWAFYSAALTMSVFLNGYLLLMVAVHAAAVPILAHRRSTTTRWAVASSLALVPVAPFLVFSHTQISQIAWIVPLGPGTVYQVAVDQYFDGSVPFAIAAGALAAAAIVPRIRRIRAPGGAGRLAAVAVTWTLLPTSALLAYSAVSDPIYYPRYLCFTAPGMALLLGICVVSVARSATAKAAVLLLLTVAAVPNYVLVQHGPQKREGMDFSEVADVITYHAAPGDCLLLDNTTSWRPGPIRALVAARPGAYRKLVDLGRGVPGTVSDHLWDGAVPVWTVQDELRRCSVLWTVSQRDQTLPDYSSGDRLPPGPRLGSVPVYQVPYGYGFRIVERWQFNFAQITKSIRDRGTGTGVDRRFS